MSRSSSPVRTLREDLEKKMRGMESSQCEVEKPYPKTPPNADNERGQHGC